VRGFLELAAAALGFALGAGALVASYHPSPRFGARYDVSLVIVGLAACIVSGVYLARAIRDVLRR